MCEFEFVGGMHTARIKPHMCIYSDAEEERQDLIIEPMPPNIDQSYLKSSEGWSCVWLFR